MERLFHSSPIVKKEYAFARGKYKILSSFVAVDNFQTKAVHCTPSAGDFWFGWYLVDPRGAKNEHRKWTKGIESGKMSAESKQMEKVGKWA